MPHVVHVAASFSLAIALAGVAGCESGGSNSGAAPAGGSASSASSDLRSDVGELGAAYLDYHDVNAAGPPDWETLLAFAGERSRKTDAIQRVRDAGYQVQWGVKISDVGATGGSVFTFVLAESPQGGPKLMLDGSVSR